MLKMDGLYVGVEGRHIKSPSQKIFKELASQSLKELEKSSDFTINRIFRIGFARALKV